MASVYSRPPNKGWRLASRIASSSSRLYRYRSHFKSGAGQPLPRASLKAAESRSSHRSDVWIRNCADYGDGDAGASHTLIDFLLPHEKSLAVAVGTDDQEVGQRFHIMAQVSQV